MGKLTEKERRYLREDLRTNTGDREAITKKYGISERQYQYYLKEVGLSKDPGRAPKEKEVLSTEVKDEEVDIMSDEEEEKQPEAEQPKKEEPGEIPKADILPAVNESDLDPDKDYCGDCLENGTTTEIAKTWSACPTCGTQFDR